MLAVQWLIKAFVMYNSVISMRIYRVYINPLVIYTAYCARSDGTVTILAIGGLDLAA